MALIELRNASVWLDGDEILKSLSWQLRRGAHCAFVGGNGAGKSTFLRLLAGRIWPRSHTSRIYDFGSGPTWSPLRARPKIALLSPELQERFVRQLQDGPDNERGWRLNSREAILAGLFDAELLHQKPSHEQEKRAEEVMDTLGIGPLVPRPLQTLSQGEMRRVLLARALVSRPEVLLLDEACSGLDAAARAAMLELIESLAQKCQTTLVMTSHREEEIVGAVAERFWLKNGEMSPWETTCSPPFANKGERSLNPDVLTKNELKLEARKDAPLIELQNASVFLDSAPILRDLNWELVSGQHFAIEGANGSGKTTFLRLLHGEIHPALGGKIVRFGETKLQSRAAIGRKIAFLSPATQARYDDEISVEMAVASGFFRFVWRLGNVVRCDATPDERDY
jgi:molybdate transport system ATP-binding protein